MSRKTLVLILVVWASWSAADVREITVNDDLRNAIAALNPGDVLILNGGTYSLNSRFNVSVVGTANQPMTIRAKDGEDVLIEMNTGAQNILEVQNSQYLELNGLRFRGGSHGIRLMSSSFITIENCEIFETGDVAISANSGGTFEGLTIRGNHIHHTHGTGEGMYLGCNNNGCRVKDSLIEGNYIHHTNGPDVLQGDGIELKEGSSGNIIRHNVIHDTNYPGILTYSAVGNGPPNIIDSNVIWNTNDYGIQSAADSIIQNNILLGEAIGLQPHQSGSPSNQQLVNNTIVTQGNGIEIRGVSGDIVVANNAVYSQSGTAILLISGATNMVTVAGNVGSGGISGTAIGYVEGNGIAADFIDANFNGAPPIDVFPATGSALVTAGSPMHVAELDFNSKSRQGIADVGAYKFEVGGNPGWALAPAFKVLAELASVPNPPTEVTAD